jgi:hypothetical protein
VVITIIAILSMLVYAPYNYYANVSKVRFSAQKSQSADINTDDRNLLAPHTGCSIQKRTIATNAQHNVGFKLVILNGAGVFCAAFSLCFDVLVQLVVQ